MWSRYVFLQSHPDAVLFILCPWPRTGSNLLLTYLNSLPDVGLRWEVLNHLEKHGIRSQYIGLQSVLRHLKVSVATSGPAVGGCKLMMDQLRHFGIGFDHLQELFPQARFVILYRESLIGQYISWQLGAKTGVWMVEKGKSDAPSNHHQSLKIHFDIAHFQSFVTEVRKRFSEIAADPWVARQGVLIRYEDLSREPDKVIRTAICPAIGLPQAPVSTRLVKQNTRDPQQVIENYGEVESFLRAASMDDSCQLTPDYIQQLFST